MRHFDQSVRRQRRCLACRRGGCFLQGQAAHGAGQLCRGGPTDVEARLFAKYIGRHIPGTPNVIVQNNEGAGGLVGTSYIGEIAPKDGTVMGYLSGAAWRYVNDPAPHRVDFSTYEFIATQPGTSSTTCAPTCHLA
jgi:hypothetical protein